MTAAKVALASLSAAMDGGFTATADVSAATSDGLPPSIYSCRPTARERVTR